MSIYRIETALIGGRRDYISRAVRNHLRMLILSYLLGSPKRGMRREEANQILRIFEEDFIRETIGKLIETGFVRETRKFWKIIPDKRLETALLLLAHVNSYKQLFDEHFCRNDVIFSLSIPEELAGKSHVRIIALTEQQNEQLAFTDRLTGHDLDRFISQVVAYIQTLDDLPLEEN